jgi:hypothetical protein
MITPLCAVIGESSVTGTGYIPSQYANHVNKVYTIVWENPRIPPYPAPLDPTVPAPPALALGLRVPAPLSDPHK